MATFNDMIASFQSILNRDDCTTAQATTFLQQAFSRIQRTARLPFMERQMQVLTGGPLDWIAVPADLLSIIDIYVPDTWTGRPKPLEKRAFRDLMKIDPLMEPHAYARIQGQLWVRGQIPTGTTVTVHYYGELTPFPTPDSQNELSASSPDLAVYAALSYAGETFEHPAADKWEARYQQILNDVIGMAADLENSGGPAAVQPIYGDW